MVIEGNRRISALKVLQNPQLAISYSARVKQLSSSVVPIKKIYVLLAPNRNDVSNLLANRHTRKTTRPWKPLRQAHFYYSQLSRKISIEDLKNKYKGVDIKKFIKMCEIHRIAASYDFGESSTNNKARDQRTFPISTVERLYDDTKFREHLNFDFDKNGKIKIYSSKKRFDEEFKKIILDAIEKDIDTRTLRTEEDRKEYYETEIRKLNKTNKLTRASKYKSKPLVKRKRISASGLFDNSLVCTINSKGIERVLKELQTINYLKFPNAAHDLMRSFLEAVLKEYLKHKGHIVTPKRSGGYIFLDDVLNGANDYFGSKRNHQIRQVVTDIIKEKETLDCINHNPSIFSTGDRVKNAADQMSDLIKYIFDDCKQ